MKENIKILHLRKERGISRKFLSKKTNISYGRLKRIEQENAKVTIDELSKIAVFFNVDINFFI